MSFQKYIDLFSLDTLLAVREQGGDLRQSIDEILQHLSHEVIAFSFSCGQSLQE